MSDLIKSGIWKKLIGCFRKWTEKQQKMGDEINS